MQNYSIWLDILNKRVLIMKISVTLIDDEAIFDCDDMILKFKEA